MKRSLIWISLLALGISCAKPTCPVPESKASSADSLDTTSLTSRLVTLALQPDSLDGKDALIWHTQLQSVVSATDSLNYGGDTELLAMEWIYNGNPISIKSLIEFDIQSIPSTATIKSATLSLYYSNNSPNPGHSNISGSNAGVIEQIVEPWEEYKVTWNTRPAVTNENQVVIPAPDSSNQDFPSIDVTKMVQQMVANPYRNHGFMISMQIPTYYRSLLFVSSDHRDSSKHPKLVVTYEK